MNELNSSRPCHFLERTPHGYCDTKVIIDDLRAGGFTMEPLVERVEHRSRASTAAEAAVAYCEGTNLRAELELRGPGALAVATATATQAIESRFGANEPEARISAPVLDVCKAK